MSPAKAPPSPLGVLGELPAEIRIEIYKHALTSGERIEVSRIRVKNPDIDEGKDKHLFRWQRKKPRCFWRSKATVKASRGSGKALKNFAVVKALGLNLLSASKAIREEALPIFYGLNTFDFESDDSVGVFAGTLSQNIFMQLTRVSIACYRDNGGNAGLERLMGLPKARLIELRIMRSINRSYNYCSWMRGPAKAFAANMWDRLEPLIAVEEFSNGRQRDDFKVELPIEMQLQRLNILSFSVDRNIEFETSVGGGRGKAAVIENEEERCDRFKDLLIDLLEKDVEKSEKLAKRKQDVLAEMMRSGPPFRQTAAANRLAFE